MELRIARPNGKQGRGYMSREEKANRPVITWAFFSRVMSYMAPYWKQLVLMLTAIGLSAWLNLLPAILTGRIIDEGLIGQDFNRLLWLIGQSFVVILTANLIGVAESFLSNWIAQHMTLDMRNAMFKHLLKMPHHFYTSNNQGDIITRMTSDISGVQQVMTSTVTSILSNSLTLGLALLAMLQKSVPLALVGLIIIPLFIIPTKKMGKLRWQLTSQAQATEDQVNGILNETLSVSGQLLVKLFNQEKQEADRYESFSRDLLALNMKERMAGRWFRVAMSTFSSVGPLLLYLVGGSLMMHYDATLSVGDITVMVVFLGKMYGPVNSLLNIQIDWIRSMALFTRIFDYFDRDVEIESPQQAIWPAGMGEGNETAGVAPSETTTAETSTAAAEASTAAVTTTSKPSASINSTTTSKPSASADLIFDQVVFAYDSERPILKDINFTVQPGETVAIVGPSGAGKSSLINLLPRLHDVDAGSIRLNGVDLRDLDLHYLRETIGIVTQDTYLFNGTIKDNLLYAKADATNEELVEACRLANIHDLITRLPQGYDSLVGNRGLKLSGGEKQRLSIARVLLKNPAILIFDEATSSLDSISESLIQAAIEPLIQSRTSLMIAHRLSTILSADKILVIEQGQLVAQGSHQDLLNSNALYTELYETQFKQEKNEPATEINSAS
ncbi:ABC transporter ATP-binding protein [Fundicoccus sp. Sow4_F4]|uniref:ABC transporter ATP-binding protein n=1 Tax=Fundicoccus sp. Sow4_F4 TaxID=3438783 RepID=UPI003F90F727